VSIPDPLISIRAMLADQPLLILLAGSNGAGKTTFFEEYLHEPGLPFVDATRVARALRAAEPGAAAGEIDRRAFAEAETLRAALVSVGLPFCTETVFSDPDGAKLRFLDEARSRGFAVFMVFIGLDSPALSVARVKHRAEHGGEDIPDEKLRARFPRTLANLGAAIPLADETFLFDNSSHDEPYRIVAVYEQGRLVAQFPPLPRWTEGLPSLHS
jgi:predicted ABC-type ATPase